MPNTVWPSMICSQLHSASLHPAAFYDTEPTCYYTIYSVLEAKSSSSVSAENVITCIDEHWPICPHEHNQHNQHNEHNKRCEIETNKCISNRNGQMYTLCVKVISIILSTHNCYIVLLLLLLHFIPCVGTVHRDSFSGVLAFPIW